MMDTTTFSVSISEPLKDQIDPIGDDSITAAAAHSTVLPKSKRIKKSKTAQKESLAQISSVSGISSLSEEDQKKYKRKFMTVVNYRLKEDNKERRKTIKFGKVNFDENPPIYEDYIFIKDEEQRSKLFYRANDKAIHPLNPKWWRLYALNTSDNVKDSYENLIKILQNKWGLESYKVNLKLTT
jgi:hypothetical protein